MLRNSVVVVVVRTRLQTMPLATITMRKSAHGFPFLSYMSMGLRLAFGPPELRYYTVIRYSPAARVFYISLVFSNSRPVISQCNTRFKLLYLLAKAGSIPRPWICGTEILSKHRVLRPIYLQFPNLILVLNAKVTV